MTTSLNILHYHLIEQIISNLSASDAACFLAVNRLLRDPGMATLKGKYVTILRDIPEYADWLRTVLSKGHRAFLIGRDLDQLMMRLEDPLVYWQKYCGPSAWDQKPLRLWLAVMVRRDLPPSSRVSMDGDVLSWGDEKVFKKEGKPFFRHVLPLPGALPQPPRHVWWDQYDRWERSYRDDSNNLQIVSAQYDQWWASDNSRVRFDVRMCPLQAADRGSKDLMRGFRVSKSKKLLCESLSPGTNLSMTPLRQVIPKLPYLDLKTGQSGFAENASSEEGRPRDDYAITIQFRCFGGSQEIRVQNQGIPW